MDIFVPATMMRTFVGLIFVSLLFLLYPQTTHAVLSISPTETFALPGDTVRLNCTFVSINPVNWKHQPIGQKEAQHVFDQLIGMTLYYRNSRRFNVELERGRCDLVITNISRNDAGTYICSEDMIEEDKVELVVLDSNPKCDSNTSLEKVLVNNDCNLAPDYIELRCTVGYHGHIPPVLEWYHSNSDVMMTSLSRISTPDTYTSIMTLTANMDLNGTHFACKEHGVGSDRRRAGCLTGTMTVMYFFSSPYSSHMEIENGESLVNVPCVANTSEPCSYRWQATDVRTNNRVEILGQTISMIPTHYDNVRCFAECRLRNETCSTLVMHLEIEVEEIQENDNLFTKILLPALLLIVVILVALVVLLKCRRRLLDLFRKNRRPTNPADEDWNEIQRLNRNSYESLIDFIRENESTLVECLDTENGLADCLLSKGVLNAEQHNEVTSRILYPVYRKQNKALLEMVIPKMNSESTCNLFMEALIETDQKHIYNFIEHQLHRARNISSTDDQVRILSGDELDRIDRHTFFLVSLIDVNRKHFLKSLVISGCITERHIDRVGTQPANSDKNKELLSIIRRRSNLNFASFIDALKRTKQVKAVQLLEQNTGNVIPVHCEISTIEGDAISTSEDIKEIETKISELLNNTRGLSRKQKQSVARRLRELSQQYLIDLMAAYPTGSIVVYFLCQTFRSIVVLKGMIDSGQMKNILEDIFNCILKNDSIRLKLEVSLELEEYQKRIQEARKTIYFETQSNEKQQRYQAYYIQYLPEEVLEIILSSSMIGMMSVQWMANVRDNESVSGSYHLYETVFSRTWMSANISLKSVTYQWMHARYVNRGMAFKQIFLRRLREHSAIFIEQLNCRYVFVDCLEKEGIITEEERRNIMEADGDVATRTYEDIPKSCWPQMRDSEQMLMSNKKLLKCLFGKNYSQISKFLKLMEETGMTHILNYFINSGGSHSLGDIFPLKNEHRSNIIKCGTAIVSEMNVFVEQVKEIKKNDENNGPKNIKNKATGVKFPPFEKSTVLNELNAAKDIGFKPSNGRVHFSTTIDELDPQREETGSIRDRQNLIDLLYNEGCISLLHKQHIEQQPTQQLQNLEMLQLIKNGSIKTFKVALEYFRRTNQDHVFDMLNRKYFSELCEEINLQPTVEDVAGAAWLEDRIYVVCDSSNKVHIFQDKGSFYELNRESIVVNGLSEPRDMVACKFSRSIFISDPGNQCVWKIQMPEKNTSRKGIDDYPGNISVASFDALLLVCAARGERFNLNIYKTSDLFLIKSILLPTSVKHLVHAVQLLNGNCIVCYSKVEDPDSFLISELSVGDGNFICSFDPRSIDLIWNPEYLSMDEDENIFIADGLYDRVTVVLLNYRWTDVQILWKGDTHSIEEPMRLCYVREKQQLIIAPDVENLRVFNLFPSVLASTQRESELEIIKSGLLADMKPQLKMPSELVREFEVKETKGDSSVHGVAWLDNKIYVVCVDSNRVHVFPGEGALDELREEGIKIKKMKDPWDISASQVSRSLFISDRKNKCLWRVQTPGKQTIQRKMDGKPSTLSITPSDELIVVVDREGRYYLDVYDCLGSVLSRRIPLSTETQDVLHAVQLSTGNIIISYSTQNFPDVYQISELSADGTKIIRTFEPRTVGRSDMMHWEPDHLSLDGAENLFVAEYRRERVYWLNDQWTDCQIVSTKYRHRLRGPHRLCYIRDTQQLIVGQLGEENDPGLVCVLDLNMNN